MDFKNSDKKLKSLFFIIIILIYLQKYNCFIDNLSIDNFFIREKKTDLNIKIEEFHYKINSDFQVYLDLDQNSNIEFNSHRFHFHFNFLKDLNIINNDIYETVIITFIHLDS